MSRRKCKQNKLNKIKQEIVEENNEVIKQIMTRAEYYKHLGLSGSEISRPDDIADDIFMEHCDMLKEMMENFIDFCKAKNGPDDESLFDAHRTICNNYDSLTCTCPKCWTEQNRGSGEGTFVCKNCGAKLFHTAFSSKDIALAYEHEKRYGHYKYD